MAADSTGVGYYPPLQPDRGVTGLCFVGVQGARHNTLLHLTVRCAVRR
jgi:hypothetical protein